jgi:hypothetical protein
MIAILHNINIPSPGGEGQGEGALNSNKNTRLQHLFPRKKGYRCNSNHFSQFSYSVTTQHAQQSADANNKSQNKEDEETSYLNFPEPV